jgi:hypothetical protein
MPDQIELFPDMKKRRIPAPKRRMVTRTAPTPPPVPEGPRRVSLSIRHTINGISYGPGTVEVDAGLAVALLENEQRNIAEERGLTMRRAHIIAPGGRTIPVAPETFDDPSGMFGMPATLSVQGG